MKKRIVLLQHYYNAIGGIETFILNFIKTFGDTYDITLVCGSISDTNALMLMNYCDIVCLPTPIECDTCIITSVLVDEKMFKCVKYNEIFQMIHSDWTAMKNFWSWKFQSYDPNTKYIAVSKIAQESFKREYGHESVIIENIVTVPQPVKKLRLISATRLTQEKGFARMCKLCDLFNKNEIPFEWDVYGTNPCHYNAPAEIKLHPAEQGASKYFINYDYVVQLSDTESFCYTMYEALTAGVPVLATPFPNAVDVIKNGVNGYLLPFDMKMTGEDLIKIRDNIPSDVHFEQNGVVDKWKKLLN